MTDAATSAGDEPVATDLDSIITHALTERGDDAVAAADVESFRAAQASGASASEPAQAASTGEPSSAAEPAWPESQWSMQPIEPPARWTSDKKAQFATWPRDVQQAVVARNSELEADYTRKTQDAAELRRTAEPYLNAIKPFEAYLNELGPIIGQTPDAMIASLLGLECQLRTGDPQQKAKALQDIAASYGIDLAAFNHGEQLAEHGASQTRVNAPVDPHYQQLRQSFGTLEQRLAHTEQMIEAERQRQTAHEVEAFASARDALGRPRYPYFERVRGVMSQMLRDEPALTLEAAYQKAIEPLQQAIAEELRIHQETADRQRRQAVEKARKVAPVKSSGSQPNGSAKAKDLDALLWDNINTRLA
jgi:hypothetical protein